ncbi:MAG: TetR/AcrR family transcriptional regulator [Chloroflexi bacterium]|nr:TetR/AcrR family transcriptional regulator [Chloroflexota bacterium]
MNDERRNRILDACAALLLKYGYDKTTVSEIAVEAGVSKGAIYLHFPSKEALAEALIWREAEIAQREIAARLAADPSGGSFISLYLHSLRVATERPLLRAFYANRKHVFGDLLRTLAPKFASARSRQAAVEFVQQYQTLGLIRADVDPKLVSFLLAFMRYGLLVIDEVIPREEMPEMEDVLMLMAEVLSRGLGGEGGNTAVGRDMFNKFVRDAVEKGKSGIQPDEEGK